jgi:hypothetical protein
MAIGDFIQRLGALQQNPQFIGGLEAMAGRDPTERLRAMQIMRNDEAKMQVEQDALQRSRASDAVLQESGGELNDRVLAKLRMVDPERAIKYSKMLQEQRQQEMMLQMAQSQDPNVLRALGIATDNTAAVTAAGQLRPEVRYNQETMGYDTITPEGRIIQGGMTSGGGGGYAPQPPRQAPVNDSLPVLPELMDGSAPNAAPNASNPFLQASPRTQQDMIKDAAKNGMTYTQLGELVPIVGGDVDIKRQSGLKSMEDAVKQVDELISHKGFSSSVGSKIGEPAYAFGFNDKPFEGSEAAGFNKRLEQVQGGAFLQAFEMLKGGGAITEMEGEKATKAKMRMDAATSEDEFKAASKDFQDSVKAGYEKLSGKRFPEEPRLMSADALRTMTPQQLQEHRAKLLQMKGGQ